MQWNKTPVPFMKPLLSQAQSMEQTQELRLPEGMPEIGRILGAWGQCIIRSKEWRSDAFSVSGGIQCWVLYTPEEGTAPRCIGEWIPFQAKWNMPQTRREAAVAVSCCLHGMDARVASPRKILVRANLGLSAEGLEPDSQLVYCPEGEDKDVKLLKQTYPAVLPREAGEKRIGIEENLPFDAAGDDILGWDAEPVLTEQAVLGDKAVFKGNCRLQLLYMTESGQIRTESWELPFAQYADLETEYDKEATVRSVLCMSELEPELTENGLIVRCGILVQYVVYSPTMLQLAQDAYSPFVQVEVESQTLSVPVLLDTHRQDMDARLSVQTDMTQVHAVRFYPGICNSWHQAEQVNGELSGVFRVLGTDAQGEPVCQTEIWTDSVALDAAPDCTVHFQMEAGQKPEATALPGRLELSVPLTVTARTERLQSLPMLTECRTGEALVPDPMRPTLIVKRQEAESLWDLAKRFGSTVDAISKANGLEGEPTPGQLLLIPVC